MSPLDNQRDLDGAFEAGATLDDLYANTSPIELPKPLRRPVIRLGSSLDDVVSKSIAALRADTNLFQRNGRLVTVVGDAETATDADGQSFVVQVVRVHALPKAAVRVRLSAVAVFQKFTQKHDWQPVAPPEDIAAAVMDVGEWPGIPPLTGIIETPLMRPDGTIVNASGYDAATGTFYAPQCEYGVVPERPTREQARAALEELTNPFADFPVSSEAGRMIPIAQILTIVARTAIEGATPGAFFDASTRGSGKTLQAQTVCRLALGHEVGVTTWSNKPDEVEKVLSSVAAKGSPVLLFDNVNGLFGGDAIDKALTATDKVSFRTLGKTEQNEVRFRTVILATGNNAQIADDTSRRIIVQRLEPNCENPEARPLSSYKIRDLARWAKENHPRVVVAALTLLRAYIVAGRPSQDLAAWGSFQPWVDLIASAIRWAGGANVLECIHTASGEEDETTANKRSFVFLWGTLAREPMTVPDAINRLYPTDFFRHPPIDGYDDLRAAIEALSGTRPGEKPNPRSLGIAMRSLKGRFFGRRCLMSEKSAENRPAKWFVKEAP